MTLEYAKLSLRAGAMAVRIDAALGTNEVTFLGAHCGELTEELLAEVKQRALAGGMTDDALALIEADVARIVANPELISRTMAIQALWDATSRKP